MHSIGQRVYERRTQLGLSQQDLADRVGYASRGAINKIEKGLRGIPSTYLPKFAKALQVSSAWLLGETDVCNECITICHKKIGDRISERRIELGMSQQQLASKVGYSSNTTINKIEKGTRDFPRYLVTRFAVALEVPVSYLLEEDPPNEELYERVGRCFEESNLTYVEFEKKTGIPKSSLQRYVSGETKKIPVEALEKMAVLFGVSLTWLLYGREDQPEDRQLQFNEAELKKEEITEEKEMATKSSKWLSDAEVEAEIEALKDSEYIKLARKELRLIYKRRQVLYQLRNLEKRGKELASQGYTVSNIGEKMFGGLEDDGEEA